MSFLQLLLRGELHFNISLYSMAELYMLWKQAYACSFNISNKFHISSFNFIYADTHTANSVFLYTDGAQYE